MKIRKKGKKKIPNTTISFHPAFRIYLIKKKATVTARRKLARLKNKNRRRGKETRDERERERGEEGEENTREGGNRGGNECQRRQGRLKCGRHNLTGDRGNFRPTSPSPEPCLFLARGRGCFPAWPLNVDENISGAAAVVYYEERTSGVRPFRQFILTLRPGKTSRRR